MIERKCKVCKMEALLTDAGPHERSGSYMRVFECRNGHVAVCLNLRGRRGQKGVAS